MGFGIVYLSSTRYGDLPEYVKQAEALEPDAERAELARLPDEAFADPYRRRYPVHTKAACYLSNVEFWDGALFAQPEDAPAYVGRNLLAAARAFRIEPEVRNVATKVAADHAKYTAELPDDSYALAFDWDGTRQRFFPVIDAASVKSAAAGLYANRDRFPYDLRKRAAARILEKAASLGVSATTLEGYDYLEAASGRNPTTSGWVSDAFAIRTNFLLGRDGRDVGDQLDKQAAAIRKLDEVTPAFVEKAAAMLDRVDRETGIFRHYGRGGLPLPEETIYRSTTKVASATATRTAKLQNGNRVDLDLVKRAGVEAFAVLPEYLDAVTTDGEFDPDKAIAVLPSMPRDDANLYQSTVNALSK